MSEQLPRTANPFTGRMVAILIAVAMLSLGAVLTLMAWSPDLSPRDTPGATPYSRSATGYSGLVDMLEASGQQVQISRLEQSIRSSQGRFLVVTLASHGPHVEASEIAEPALVVLPKWDVRASRTKRAWELDAELASIESVDAILGPLAELATVDRVENPPALPFGRAVYAPDFEDQMQVIRSDMLEPVIDTNGGQLLSKLPGREIYILADPDLFNNFGIARLENAKTGLHIMQYMTGQGRFPLVFDATLHGFERSTNLLKILLDIPYLGATFVALATMLLIGWAAAIRFGAPEHEARALAAGKEALADNSAGLIAMAKRERRMAPGYLALSRRALSRELGLPKTLSETEYTDLLDRIATRAGLDQSFSSLNEALSGPAASRDDLKHKARAIWRWRKEVKHGQ